MSLFCLFGPGVGPSAWQQVVAVPWSTRMLQQAVLHSPGAAHHGNPAMRSQAVQCICDQAAACSCGGTPRPGTCCVYMPAVVFWCP
jgi:hypothetical protein